MGLEPVTAVAPCALCGSEAQHLVRLFTARPDGETDFGLDPYRRELWQCDSCGHVVNRHRLPLDRFYDRAYIDATYGDRLAATFERIMALPAGKSDNRNRIARINDYADAAGLTPPRRALDVGAGLGVFAAALAATGWRCVAVDPDPRAVSHLRERAGVEARCGDFMAVAADAVFDLVSFNKVLEHVADPVAMLARARAWLTGRGVVYVELPDGEAALADGPAREEFFIEHYAAYSAASLALLCRRAGYRADRIERLREPSGKYTLVAFLTCP